MPQRRARPVGRDPATALSDAAVAGVTRLTALDTVRGRIGLAIELGLLRSGDRLPDEQELAEALSVSRITARRALQSLATDGLLERRRGRAGGTFVGPDAPNRSVTAVSGYRADDALVHDLIDRRTLMECALAHWAARNADGPVLTELDQTVATMSAATTWADYHLADEHFHRTVAQASGQSRLVPAYEAGLAELYQYFLPYPIDYLRGVNDDHADLVACPPRARPGAGRRRDRAARLSPAPDDVRGAVSSGCSSSGGGSRSAEGIRASVRIGAARHGRIVSAPL